MFSRSQIVVDFEENLVSSLETCLPLVFISDPPAVIIRAASGIFRA